MIADSDPRIASFRAALDAQPLRRFQVTLVALVALLLVTDGYDAQAIGFVAPVLAKQWGLARGAFGPVFSAGLVGTMLGALIFTPVADRLGARRVLLACVAFYGVASLLTIFVRDRETLLALRLVTGLGIGGAMPNGIALVSDYAPTRARTMMVAIAVCGFSLGGALGGLLAAAAMERFGWQSVFIVGGLAPLLMLPWLAWTVPESLPRLLAGPPDRLAAMLGRLAPGWRIPVGAGPPPPRSPVAALFADGLARPTLLIWTAFFCNLLLLYFLANWLPSIVHASGLSLGFANLVTAFYQGGGTAGALVLAWLCDRLPPARVLCVAFLGAALTVALIGSVAAEPPLLMAVVTLAGFCVVGGQLAANAFAGTYYPAAIRATGVGWALGVGRFGSIFGPLIGGVLIQLEIPLATLFRLGAIPACAAGLAVLLVRRRAPAPRNEGVAVHG